MRFAQVFVPLGLKTKQKQDEEITSSIETPTTKTSLNCHQTKPDRGTPTGSCAKQHIQGPLPSLRCPWPHAWDGLPTLPPSHVQVKPQGPGNAREILG